MAATYGGDQCGAGVSGVELAQNTKIPEQ